MPKKAEVQEEEVPAEEPQEEAPVEAPQEEVVPESPEPEEVTVKPTSKAASKAKAKPPAKRKNAPPATKKKEPLDLKQKHECGQCGKVMSLHTALYGHKNCPGGVSVPQPPALTRQVVVEEAPPRNGGGAGMDFARSLLSSSDSFALAASLSRRRAFVASSCDWSAWKSESVMRGVAFIVRRACWPPRP